MSKKIKWGIIALGRIAEKFASDIKFVENAELVAVASRSPEKSKAFAKKFDVQRAYGSYEEMLKDDEIDVVYIASPHTYHYEHTLMCFEYNKHVLCEKPMGMNSQQVKEMVSLAGKKGLYLMEAFWTRFTPSFLKCISLIKEGAIGEIRSIQADFGFVTPNNPEGRWLNKKLGGGSLLDIGIYPVFLALNLLGKPDEIIARAHLGETGVDLNTAILFNYNQKRALANLSSTFEADTPVEAVISGTKGRIKFNRWWHTPTSLEFTAGDKNTEYKFEEPGFGYQYETIRVCSDLIDKKSNPEIFTHANSIELHETLDAIRKLIGLTY